MMKSIVLRKISPEFSSEEGDIISAHFNHLKTLLSIYEFICESSFTCVAFIFYQWVTYNTRVSTPQGRIYLDSLLIISVIIV